MGIWGKDSGLDGTWRDHLRCFVWKSLPRAGVSCAGHKSTLATVLATEAGLQRDLTTNTPSFSPSIPEGLSNSGLSSQGQKDCLVSLPFLHGPAFLSPYNCL